MATPRLIGWRQISAKIDRSRTWIFSKARSGEFPRPLELDDLPGKALWSEQEVDAWIAERIAGARVRAEARARKAADDARPAA